MGIPTDRFLQNSFNLPQIELQTNQLTPALAGGHKNQSSIGFSRIIHPPF
jgi:hypothetical protein